MQRKRCGIYNMAPNYTFFKGGIMEPQIGDRVRATMNGEDWFEGRYVKKSEVFVKYGVKRDDIGDVRYFIIAEKIADVREIKAERDDLFNDCMVMALRLYGEDPQTFGPECWEVMHKWWPRVKAVLDAG